MMMMMAGDCKYPFKILEAIKGLNVSLLFSENSLTFLTLHLFLYKILLIWSSAEGGLIFENNCWAMSLLLHCESIKAYESKFFFPVQS